MKKWRRKETKVVFETKHFKVREDIVELPSRKLKEWVYWDSVDSVMVIAMTKEKKLVMIRQYRYLVGGEVIEFPSGALHKNENVKDGARRELEEETGFKCGPLVKLGSFYETYGQLNRQIHFFFTKDVVKFKQNLDKGKRGFEDIKVELVDFDKVVELALKNKVVAMGSSLAILLLKEKIDRGEIKLDSVLI